MPWPHPNFGCSRRFVAGAFIMLFFFTLSWTVFFLVHLGLSLRGYGWSHLKQGKFGEFVEVCVEQAEFSFLNLLQFPFQIWIIETSRDHKDRVPKFSACEGDAWVELWQKKVADWLRYLGPEYEHPGFVLSYGIGHILIIALGEGLSRRFTPPALDEQYAQKMGPATLGAALLGFFVCTTAFSCLKLGGTSRQLYKPTRDIQRHPALLMLQSAEPPQEKICGFSLAGYTDASHAQLLWTRQFGSSSTYFSRWIRDTTAGETAVFGEQSSHPGFSTDLHGPCHGRGCSYDAHLVRHVPCKRAKFRISGAHSERGGLECDGSLAKTGVPMWLEMFLLLLGRLQLGDFLESRPQNCCVLEVRAGMLDRALAILTCGRRTPTRCSLLLQEVKYCTWSANS